MMAETALGRWSSPIGSRLSSRELGLTRYAEALRRTVVSASGD